MPTMSLSLSTPVTLREVTLPKEHGSWSLAFEPLVFALLIAPSWPGIALAVSVAAAFFARRPLRLVVGETDESRRTAAQTALALCSGLAVAGGVAAIALGGTSWLTWLVPSIVAAAVFVFFDLRKENREQVAELAGTVAFAWLPAAFAALAGWSAAAACAAGLVMAARAVPTVLCVRATIRRRKTGTAASTPALTAAAVALVTIVALARAGAAPWTVVVLATLLAGRTVALLVYPRPTWRARTIGWLEAAIGAMYVIGAAAAWRF